MIHFEAFIQLISAINFTYILSKFSNVVYLRIFDEKRMFTQRFTTYIDTLAAYRTTLEQMSPIKTTDGKSTENAINDLKQRYNNLESRWHHTEEEVKGMISKMNDVKGLRCLFLFASLFCIIDLFNIAWYYAVRTDFTLVFTFAFNFSCAVILICLSRIIWLEKWKGKDDSYCYEWTSNRFVISLGGSICLAVINWGILFFICFPIPLPLYRILSSLCILNAIYPLMFTVFYIKLSVHKIGRYSMNQTKALKAEFDGLNNDKKKIDHTYEVLAQDVSWNM